MEMESDKIMARYHVRADGSMGVCTAREGNCPFGGDAGTRHFTNKSEAQAYSEERIKAVEAGKSLGGGFRKISRTRRLCQDGFRPLAIRLEAKISGRRK